MKALSRILTILILISIISTNSISSNPSYEDFSQIFLQNIKIGPSSKEISMIINSLSSQSVLFTNSKRDYSIEIQRKRKSDVLIDKINFNGEIIQSFAFNLRLDETKLNNAKIQGEFGLGLDKENSNDLIDTLYENNIINNKVLELDIITKNNKDVLNLNFEPKMDEFKYCDLASKNDLGENNFFSEAWMCDISHVIIGSNKGDLSWNNTLETKGKVVIDTRTKYIYIPKIYLKYISTLWSINNNECEIELDPENNEQYFFCNTTSQKNENNNIILSMPSIYLIIGGYGYKLKAENLFEQEGNCLNSLIRFVDEKNDLWILGIPFLKEYKILLDYNSTRIGFHGEDVINYKEEYEKWANDNKEQKLNSFFNNNYELIIMIVGCLIGTCIIIYVLYHLCKDWIKSSKNVKDKYFIQTDEKYKIEEKYQ